MKKFLILFFFIFCGIALQSKAHLVPMSFWKSHGLFNWMGGNNTMTYSGVFGTQGIGSTDNTPSGREAAASWTDASGNLWLFGGYGSDFYGNVMNLSDLWEYTPANGKWTWVGGPSGGNNTGGYGTQNVADPANWPGARQGASTWVDGSGNLWLFSGEGMDCCGFNGRMSDLWKYNPTSGQWTWVSGPQNGDQSATYGTKGGTGATTNIPGARSFANGWMDSSGNFWIFGGIAKDVNSTYGIANDLWRYVPGTGKWTWISGDNTQWSSGVYGTKGVASTTNTPGSRGGQVGYADSSGFLWLFGGYGADSTGSDGYLNDLWRFEVSTKKWTWMTGSTLIRQPGTGTKGVGSTANSPGARDAFGGAKDSSGNFWILGGVGIDSTSTEGTLGDLWRYTPADGQWTWISGASTLGETPVFGTRGVTNASNRPGSHRGNFPLWGDPSGNLWVGPGIGFDSVLHPTYLDTLWKYSISGDTWTWMAGRSTNLQMSTRGSLGVASTSYLPEGRSEGAAWVDSSGNYWIFGGWGPEDGGSPALLNDLWKYTPSNGKWAWMGGVEWGWEGGTYGSKGTGSTGNMPGSRQDFTNWTDASGNFWLFGGNGKDSTSTWSTLNDLWMYNPTSGQWTWVSGLDVGNQAGVYGTKGVANASNYPGTRDTPCSWVDASGNFWIFGGFGFTTSTASSGHLNDLWKYTPGNSQWTWISGPSTLDASATYGTKGVGSTSNRPGARGACTGNWTDSSGKLWLFGGYGRDSASNWGVLNDLWNFDPSNLKWTWVGGSNVDNQFGTYGTQGVGSTNNIPSARQFAMGWVDGAGNFWLFGGNGYDSVGTNDNMNDVWKYTPADGKWTWVAGSNLANQNASFGNPGVAAFSNTPGARSGGFLATDKNGGTVWIFGGLGVDGSGNRGRMNDLWKFSP